MNSVSRIVSPNDTMLDVGREDDYFDVGKTALGLCKSALNGFSPKRILDFPSGYGRVLRWFQAEWPQAELFAAEVNDDCLEFVNKTFDATTIKAHPRLNMTIPSNMDLIFSGSLLTHFDHWQWNIYLEMCAEALSPDGVFVFSTHGRVHALMAKTRHPIYGTIVDTRELYERYKETGFAYLPYDRGYETFGLSLSSPEWVMRKLQAMPNIKIVHFEEQGWGQDIRAVKRNPWPMV